MRLMDVDESETISLDEFFNVFLVISKDKNNISRLSTNIPNFLLLGSIHLKYGNNLCRC